MHAKDLILDFKTPAIRTIAACQEITMPFVPYFLPFLSLYATGSCIPSALNNEDDDKSDQGYSDDD